MPRIYDSSHLTHRRQEKAIAGSFISRLLPPSQTSYGPLPGIYDGSIMNAVKTGSVTQYTRYPTCIGISPGCPCPELNASLSTYPYIPAIPGAVSGITFTIGSIIVSWIPPTGGPFQYQVTPYINGVAQKSITTSKTTYKFTKLQEGKPYTFTVCAMNAGGQGPIVPSTSYIIAPPDSLSKIMSGENVADVNAALTYVMNDGLNKVLQYSAKINIGPTKGSRFVYVWAASVAQAWNWVRSTSLLTGTHDNWNWDTHNPLSESESIIWLCSAIDYIAPLLGITDKSIYDCPVDLVASVKSKGNWDGWHSAHQEWFQRRSADNNATTGSAQPDASQNVNFGKPLIVDGVTINDPVNFNDITSI